MGEGFPLFVRVITTESLSRVFRSQDERLYPHNVVGIAIAEPQGQPAAAAAAIAADAPVQAGQAGSPRIMHDRLRCAIETHIEVTMIKANYRTTMQEVVHGIHLRNQRGCTNVKCMRCADSNVYVYVRC